MPTKKKTSLDTSNTILANTILANQIQNLSSQISKLERKYKDITDQIEESSNNIEDLFDTVNSIKSSDYSKDQHIPNPNPIPKPSKRTTTDLSNLSSKSKISSPLETFITKYINISSSANSNDNDRIDNTLINYYDSQTEEQQIKITHQIEAILNDDYQNNSSKPVIFQILDSSLSPYYKKLIITKLKTLSQMDNTDSEYMKLSQWINHILAIPFNIYTTPEYISLHTAHPQQSLPLPTYQIIENARNILDGVIYGQLQAKEHILEIIGRMIVNPTSRGQVFAIEGAPGVGKTSLIKDGLAKVLGLPFVFISLGGSSDGSLLYGENYSYIGSKPGMIVQSLKNAGCMNPIFYFDELDKVSTTDRGQEIINTLIHITDYSQNSQFIDHYLDGIPIDLSRAIFVFSFNDRRRISSILLDRMEVIHMTSYTNKEKQIILLDYLLPRIVKNFFGNRKIEVILGKNPIDKKRLINKLIKSDLSSKKTKSSSRMLNIHYIAQRHRRNVFKRSHNSGVRYIEHRLEKCIAHANIQYLKSRKPANTNGDNNGDSNRDSNGDTLIKITL